MGRGAPYLRHHLDGHGLVTLVIQEKGRPAFRVVPDDPLEGHHCAVFSPLKALHQAPRFDGVARQGEEMARGIRDLVRIAARAAALKVRASKPSRSRIWRATVNKR